MLYEDKTRKHLNSVNHEKSHIVEVCRIIICVSVKVRVS